MAASPRLTLSAHGRFLGRRLLQRKTLPVTNSLMRNWPYPHSLEFYALSAQVA